MSLTLENLTRPLNGDIEYSHGEMIARSYIGSMSSSADANCASGVNNPRQVLHTHQHIMPSYTDPMSSSFEHRFCLQQHYRSSQSRSSPSTPQQSVDDPTGPEAHSEWEPHLLSPTYGNSPRSVDHAKAEEIRHDTPDTDASPGQGQEPGTNTSLSAAELRRQKKKMKRTRLDHNTTRYLLSEFNKQAHPDAKHRERLAKEIPGLSNRQVQVWFQNRRAKMKRMNSEGSHRLLQLKLGPHQFNSPYNPSALMVGRSSKLGLAPCVELSIGWNPGVATSSTPYDFKQDQQSTLAHGSRYDYMGGFLPFANHDWPSDPSVSGLDQALHEPSSSRVRGPGPTTDRLVALPPSQSLDGAADDSNAIGTDTLMYGQTMCQQKPIQPSQDSLQLYQQSYNALPDFSSEAYQPRQLPGQSAWNHASISGCPVTAGEQPFSTVRETYGKSLSGGATIAPQYAAPNVNPPPQPAHPLVWAHQSSNHADSRAQQPSPPSVIAEWDLPPEQYQQSAATSEATFAQQWPEAFPCLDTSAYMLNTRDPSIFGVEQNALPPEALHHHGWASGAVNF